MRFHTIRGCVDHVSRSGKIVREVLGENGSCQLVADGSVTLWVRTASARMDCARIVFLCTFVWWSSNLFVLSSVILLPPDHVMILACTSVVCMHLAEEPGIKQTRMFWIVTELLQTIWSWVVTQAYNRLDWAILYYVRLKLTMLGPKCLLWTSAAFSINSEFVISLSVDLHDFVNCRRRSLIHAVYFRSRSLCLLSV